MCDRWPSSLLLAAAVCQTKLTGHSELCAFSATMALWSSMYSPAVNHGLQRLTSRLAQIPDVFDAMLSHVEFFSHGEDLEKLLRPYSTKPCIPSLGLMNPLFSYCDDGRSQPSSRVALLTHVLSAEDSNRVMETQILRVVEVLQILHNCVADPVRPCYHVKCCTPTDMPMSGPG